MPAYLKSRVEALSGLAMDDVRVHCNSPEPEKLGAAAFTSGTDIYLGPGQEEHLPHEAWHVVQQKQGRVRATAQAKGTSINDDAALEAEADSFAQRVPSPAQADGLPPLADRSVDSAAVTQCRRKRKPRPPKVNERVVGRKDVSERMRTVIRIEVVGHASPRWRGARTPELADEKNWRLAEKRAEGARLEIERLLDKLLPNRNLVFEYRFRASTEAAPKAPVRALEELNDIAVDFSGRGSTETLGEAGERGRKANDDPMRRVDVQVTLHSQGETDVEEDVERRERMYGISRKWSLWVGAEIGVDAIAEIGTLIIKLRNETSGVEGTYLGPKFGLGASIGVRPAKTSIPNFERFTTPDWMNFEDFDGASFAIISSGFDAVFFGAEVALFRFTEFPGGEGIPGFISIGGPSIGGVGFNLLSSAVGWIYLSDSPSETYEVTTRSERRRTYESLGEETHIHRVLFSTGSSEVSAWQSDLLNEYLLRLVMRSGM